MDYAKYLTWMSDEAFSKLKFRYIMGYPLNLKDPKTFNEKLQWLKLYNTDPIFDTLVDKYKVKDYVADKIGSKYIVPTYGVWDSFDDIDFDSLPDSFALKCNHDSGGLYLVPDKSLMDMDAARKKIQGCLDYNYYWHSREKVYKNIKPRVLAEKYLIGGERGMTDYKFYCFGGEPKFIYVSVGLDDHATALISFLTLDWEFAPFQRIDYAHYETLPEKPQHLDEMIDIARKLSEGHRFLRIDLYEYEGQVYFSEYTIIPNGGFMKFDPPEYDKIIGEWLRLD